MQTQNIVSFKRLHRYAVEPQRSKPGDACYDLTAVENMHLEGGENRLVRTGIAIQLPPGTVGLVHSRSGLPAKHQVSVLNAPGVIDEGYTGEIMVNLMNHNRKDYLVRRGDRIAQLLIQHYLSPVFIETDQLEETERGASGHGSTGK